MVTARSFDDVRGAKYIFSASFTLLTNFLSSESSSGDRELRLFPSRRSSRLPQHDLNLRHDVDESHPQLLHHHHHHHHHREHPARLAKVMPATLLESRFHQEPGGQRSVNLLAQPHHEVQPEHVVVSARHLITVVSNLLSDWEEGNWDGSLFVLDLI